MEKVSILGVNFSDITKQEALDQIEYFMKDGKLHYIVTPNPEIVIKARKDKKYKNILNQADISIADGTGIMLAAKFYRKSIKQRIHGTDLTIDLMPIAEQNNYKIFLLGATHEVNELTSKILKYKHPKLQIVGQDAGPDFNTKDIEKNPDKFDEIINKINRSQADILLVAFGAPKQEKFIYQFKDKLNIKLALGIGGAFDYISGHTPRAPYIMRKLGLEWLFRLIVQPSRVKRIFNAIIIFPLMVIFSKNKN